MVTEEQLAELDELVAATTAAPWVWHWGSDNTPEELRAPDRSTIIETDSGVYGPNEQDARFIAAARTALPLLIAEVRRLRPLVEKARDDIAMALRSVKLAEEHIAEVTRERDALRGVVASVREGLDKIADGACRPPRGSYGSGCSGRCEAIAQGALDALAKLDEAKP